MGLSECTHVLNENNHEIIQRFSYVSSLIHMYVFLIYKTLYLFSFVAFCLFLWFFFLLVFFALVFFVSFFILAFLTLFYLSFFCFFFFLCLSVGYEKLCFFICILFYFLSLNFKLKFIFTLKFFKACFAAK